MRRSTRAILGGLAAITVLAVVSSPTARDSEAPAQGNLGYVDQGNAGLDPETSVGQASAYSDSEDTDFSYSGHPHTRPADETALQQIQQEHVQPMGDPERSYRLPGELTERSVRSASVGEISVESRAPPKEHREVAAKIMDDRCPEGWRMYGGRSGYDQLFKSCRDTDEDTVGDLETHFSLSDSYFIFRVPGVGQLTLTSGDPSTDFVNCQYHFGEEEPRDLIFRDTGDNEVALLSGEAIVYFGNRNESIWEVWDALKK